MQTGILDLKEFISKKDRRIILREEKLKKKREERKTSRSKKDGEKRRSIERDVSENWFRKNRYTRIDYSRGVVG